MKPFLGTAMLGLALLGQLGRAQSPNVTLTGVIQGANGLPAANTVLNFDPSQNFVVLGLGGGCSAGLPLQHNGVALLNQCLLNYNDVTPAAPAGDVNVTFQTDTLGNLSAWVPTARATPAGPSLSLQYNNSGAIGGTSGLATDATGQALYGTATNFFTGNPATSALLHLYPYFFNQYQTKRISGADFSAPMVLTLGDLSGSSDWLDQSNNFGNFPNLAGLSLNVTTQTPVQIGGVYDTQVNQHATNDLVLFTVNAHSVGSSNGFNEGLEMHRETYDFVESPFSGTIALLGNDALGNPELQVTGSNLGSIGEQRVLYDSSKLWSSPGNIASMGQWPTNINFELLTGDGTAGISARYGATVFTTVLGGADYNKYNAACPATITGTWIPFDPYAATAVDGTGTKTTAQCVHVASTAGIVAGQVALFAYNGPNYEYETIQSVPAAGYIVVNLKRAHSPGEYVFVGGGVGYCFQDGHATTNPCYPIAATLAGDQMLLYNNASVTFGGGELKSSLYGRNTAPTPMTITPTVVAGVVTAVARNTNNYYLLSTGSNQQLPVPNLTFGGGGCTTNPTFTWSYTTTGWNAALATGGTGCNALLTITPQSVYPNPFNVYPSTRSMLVINPTLEAAYLANPASFNYVDNSSSSGYVVVDPFAATGQWSAGDTIVQSPHWQQYIGSQIETDGNILVSRSGRVGDFTVERYSGTANATIYKDYLNTNPAKHYISQAINGWNPSNPSLPNCTAYPSLVPCYDPLDGQFSAAYVMRFGGPTGGGLTMDFPPLNGGAVIKVACKDGFGGRVTFERCNAAVPIYDKYEFLESFTSGNPMSLIADPANFNWIFNNSGVEATVVTGDNYVTSPLFKGTQYNIGAFGSMSANDVAGSTNITFLVGGTRTANVTIGADAVGGFQIDQFANIKLGNNALQQTFKFGDGATLGVDGGGGGLYVRNSAGNAGAFYLGYPNGNDVAFLTPGASCGYCLRIRTGSGNSAAAAVSAGPYTIVPNGGTGSVQLGVAVGTVPYNYTFPAAQNTFATGLLQSDTSGNQSWIQGVSVTNGFSAAMVAGTITISTAAALPIGTAGGQALYSLTNCIEGGTVGTLKVGIISSGVSFVINSSSATDTSRVCWEIH